MASYSGGRHVEDRSAIGRRDLIGVAGATGVGGVAGCLETGDDPGEQINSPATDSPVETTQQMSSGGGPIGDAVFYDPDGDSQYEDGQAALNAVPPGGTFVIGHGTWDVAEEGRLLIEKTVQVRGMGWTGNREEPNGTRIVNQGSVDEPAVEFRAPPDMDSDEPWILGSLRDVQVIHAADAPAVRIRNAIRTVIADCDIDARNTAPTALKYEDFGFFTRCLRNRIKNATEVCCQVTGLGYAHEFYSNHIATGVEGATAFQTQRQRTILVGGECASTGAGGTGVEFYNPGTNGIEAGGYVVEPGIEHTEQSLVIDGKQPFNDVQAYHVKLDIHEDSPAITFGATNNSKVINPVLNEYKDGTVARWTDRSSNCGLETDAKTMKQSTYTDEGAVNPYVHLKGSLDDGDLEQLPTGVPTTAAYNADAKAPVLHDGDRWKQVATTNYSL
jgi:hypothetical protein